PPVGTSSTYWSTADGISVVCAEAVPGRSSRVATPAAARRRIDRRARPPPLSMENRSTNPMVTTRPRGVKHELPGLVVTAVVAAITFWLAFDGGSYGLGRPAGAGAVPWGGGGRAEG